MMEDNKMKKKFKVENLDCANCAAKMENAIKNNTALFIKAENKAKELIQNYITKLSEIIDKDYTINWK
jgi:copper chaperone CopZ